MYYKTQYESPVGRITLISSEEKLVGAWLEGQKYFMGTLAEPVVERDDLPVLLLAEKWLERYFAGEKPGTSELPLAPAGSEFRQRVWGVLCEIPYGEVVTYGEVAKKVALQLGRESMSAQAVGGAVGHNPISIIIPCHRVIGADGSLTGYAGGMDVKGRLLEHEKGNVLKQTNPGIGTTRTEEGR